MTDYLHFPNGVRVSRTPDRRGYRIRFTRTDGTPGDARRSTLEDATALAHELCGLIARQQEGVPANGEAPVEALFEDWLECAGTANYSRSARAMIRRHVLPVIGHLRCADWDRDASLRVVEAAEAHGLKESTISNLARMLSALAYFGRHHGFLGANDYPAKDIWRHRKAYVDLDELPGPDDVAGVAEAAARTLGEDWRATQVLCAAYSGLRIGEVLGLQVGDVNLAEGSLRVVRQVCAADGTLIDPKYGSKRTTVYPVWLDDAYKELVVGRDAGEPLFPARRGGHERYSTFYNQRWRPAATAAGWLEDGTFRWTFHDLRHYFCTWALAGDGLSLDVADVSRFAGHKSPQTTWDTYVAPRPDRVNRAREASRRGSR